MYIAVFQNIRAVIRAEKLCREADMKVTVMPLPEHLSSECGMCLKIDSEYTEFEKLMHEAAIEIVTYDKI